MKIIKGISLIITVALLCVGFLALFFGGTLEGAKVGLMILGGVFLIQICYRVVIEEKIKKQKEEENKKITDKYFN